MKRILVGGLAIVGGIVLLMLIVVFGVVIAFDVHQAGIPARTILEVDFERGLSEQAHEDLLAEVLMEDTPLTVRQVVEALHRGATDNRVVAFIARIGSANMGLAQIQEIRDAVQLFRSHGKRAVAYAETFGEFSSGNGAYYLATAFDSIYLQPAGDVGLTGLIAESPFVRGTLEKLDLVPRLDQRKEYKNFMNMFTERQYTAAHREATVQLLESQFSQIVRGIATARQLDHEAVRRLADEGPFLGQEAVQAKLVDGLAYRDEVYTQTKEQAGKSATLLYLSKYLQRLDHVFPQEDAAIALIYGVGGVQRGSNGYDPLFDGPTMGADTVTAAFRSAVADDTVKAIIFRIDSPGGSYVASDAIWRETVKARQAGKPVIVSMGNVAGSGGYFVAMAANKIVAQPGTITGSIGVLGGKILTTGLWNKLGLSWDEVHTSAHATMWSSTQDYTPPQWQRFQAWLDRVYDDFTDKVAQGRDLPKDKVLEAAKGRIWSGEDAKTHGLVDELGGFPVALRLAREAAGLPADPTLTFKLFPEELSPWRALLARLLGDEEESSETDDAEVFLAHTRQHLQPLIRLARALGFGPSPGVLTMPEVPRAR
jgi:protease IV